MSQDLVQHATEVKRRHEQDLMRKANVVAVGVGFISKSGQQTDEVGIIVSVKKKLPESELQPQDVLPASIDDVPLDVIETGEIHAL